MAFEENDKAPAHLEELGNSKYEVAYGQPDVRGWEVTDRLNRRIGEVKELLFDPGARKVRYLVVNMESNELDVPVKHEALVPIGLAIVHEQEDAVVLPNVLPEQLHALPAYERNQVTPVIEAQTRSILMGTAAGDAIAHHDDDFYSHEHFNDQQFYAGRMANVPVVEGPGEEPDISRAAVPQSPRADSLLMDYGIAGEIINTPMPAPANSEGILDDLDERGLDISKYTGPESKSSEQLSNDNTFDQGRIHEESRAYNKVQAADNILHDTTGAVETPGVSANKFGTGGLEEGEGWENEDPRGDSI